MHIKGTFVLRVTLAFTILILALGVISVPIPARADDDAPLNVGFLDINWIPFSYQLEKHPQGFAVDVVNGVLKQMRRDVDFQRYTLADGLNGLKNGKVESFIGLGTNPERAEQFLFTNTPLFYDETVLIGRSDDSFVFNGDVSTLIGKKVAVLDGAIHGPAFDTMQGINRVPLDTSRGISPFQYFEGLLKRKYQFFALNSRAGGIYQINNFKLQNDLKVHAEPIAVKSYYLVFSKNRPNAKENAKRFDRVHKLFRSTDEYTTLLEKYNLSPKLFPR